MAVRKKCIIFVETKGINICCADMKTNKAEIYKNAFRLFLQDNYEKVTVVKLEKAIGLSCRGIYHHTKDKLGLFKAVVDTYIFEPHKVENKFVYAEDISLRDFLQTYIEGVERTMDYLSNELGVDRKECAKCYFQFLFQAYKYYPNFVKKMDAIFEKDQQMWRKIIDKAIASGKSEMILPRKRSSICSEWHIWECHTCWLLPRDLILND